LISNTGYRFDIVANGKKLSVEFLDSQYDCLFYFTEVFMENWVNLDNLPRRKDGKISWKDCNHNLVEFYYNGIRDCFIIVKRLSRHYVLVKYLYHEVIINTDSILYNRLDSLVRFN
jgi:hypothetical protein